MGTKRDYEILLKVRADIAEALGGLDNFNKGLKRTGDAAERMGSQLTGINKHLHTINAAAHDLRNAFVFAFAAHEVASFVGSLVDANTEAQKIQYTLEQVFGPQGAQEQLQFVHELAQKLGLDFKAAAEGFASFAANAQGTGIQTGDLRKLFTGLSEAATVLHSSTEDVNGVMIQLGQAMSLGKLQMQDIRAIAQHLPGTMTLISEAAQRMGINLTDALKHGGLEAKQFIGVLGDVLHERFGVAAVEASHSLNSELHRLHNTLFEVSTDGTGFADSFADAIRSLNDTLADPVLEQNLKDLVSDMGKLAAVTVGATSKIVDFGKWLGETFAAMEAGPNDPQRIDDRIGEINDQIKKLQTTLDHPIKSRLNEFLQDLSRGPNTPVGVSDEVTKTTSEINKEIAALETEKKLLQIRAKQFRAPPPAFPSGAASSAAGDIIGSILGGGGTGGNANGGSGNGSGDAAARAAAEHARIIAAALAHLQDQLGQLRSQGLTPTEAAWAKYNATVDKAIEEAKAAGNSPEAQAALAGIVEQAARLRDQGLAQIADKDREAYAKLKESLATPAEVNLDQAIAKLKQLNDLMASPNVKISAQEYADMVASIGQQSVAGALPDYRSPRGLDNGPESDLARNYAEEARLDEAYRAEKLELDKKYNDADQQQEEAHQAALAELDKEYADKRAGIEQTRARLQLDTASELFGQLATLSSSHNKKIAAIGKAAAIAQTIINTYESATEAYASLAGIPYIGPVLGAAAAAAAIAAGLANVAAIRSQPTGGYAEGGYTGRGGKYEPAGIVHRGEGVLDQGDIASLGGPSGFHALRQSIQDGTLMLPGYADGGFVAPFANAPTPAQLGFATPRTISPQLTAVNRNGAGGGAANIKVVVVYDKDAAADHILNSEAGQKVIVHTVGENPNSIRAKWGSG